MENAIAEHRRRQHDAFQARRKAKIETRVLRAFPWVRHLWEEEQAKRHWGYGIFTDPDTFANDEEAEYYKMREDGLFFYARGSIGVEGTLLAYRWKLQRPDWPLKAAADDLTACRDPVDARRAAKFQGLREYFLSIRDRAPKRQRDDRTDTSTASIDPDRSGLEEGLQRNVFLVVDKDSAASLLRGYELVDDMWIWAVDPDYDEPEATITEAPGGSSYRGFVRVRLQQILNNFYDTRRFHEDEHPMEKIWEAAQKSLNQAFISFKDEEMRKRNMDRFIGSAMRAQPPRIVHGSSKVEPKDPSAS